MTTPHDTELAHGAPAQDSGQPLPDPIGDGTAGPSDTCWNRGSRSSSFADCSHDWRMTGYARSAALDCERPVMLTCVLCDSRSQRRCGATQLDACTPCGARHRTLIARLCREGMRSNVLGLLFVTLTAPGKDLLPFDPAACRHREGVRCDGTKGCRVYRAAAAAWNSRLGLNWTHLVRDLRRRFGTVEYFKAVEAHQRGVLHVHFVCAAPAATTTALEGWLKVNAPEYGFGRVCDVQRITPGNHDHLVRVMEPASGAGANRRAEGGAEGGFGPVIADIDADLDLEIARKAGYLAKYCTKGGKRGECVDRDGEYSTVRGYRVWSATRGFGPRMKVLKARQRASWGMVGAADASLDLNSNIYPGCTAIPNEEPESVPWEAYDPVGLAAG